MSGTSFLHNHVLTQALHRLQAQFATVPHGALVMQTAAQLNDEPQTDIYDGLTIGFDHPTDGTSTVRAFVNPFPPTLAPCISGAETDGGDAHDPFDDSQPSPMTNSETNAHYLAMQDWTRDYVDGVGEVWADPLSGGSHRIAIAVMMQNARETRDCLASDAEICAELNRHQVGARFYPYDRNYGAK